MLFNSYVFILGFLPVTAAVFYWLGALGRAREAIGWLVLASLFFYGWWNPAYLLLLCGSMAFNYLVGSALSHRFVAKRPTYWLLFFGVAVNLALIGYYKYAGFFVSNYNAMTGAGIDFGTLVLPLAISFFTFQQIAFLVDAARGETHEYNFLHYALFVTFFPQLIAGPIVHHKEMLPQFARASTFRPEAMRMAIGLSIFAVGLAKKVLIADKMATFATPVFVAADACEVITFVDAWQGALAYTFQLYFDFSGYSDMAIGLARMFGIRLPLNFNAPYRATNIIEFWRRWHMTLSRFLRDYLYIPLGGGRAGPIRRYMNLLITMVLGGLWHGAAWNFIIWGTLHGVYLMINHLWRKLVNGRTFGRIGGALSLFLTFLAVVVAWVPFRATTLDGAINILRGMAGENGISLHLKYLAKFNQAGGLGDWMTQNGVTFTAETIHDSSKGLIWIGIGLVLCWVFPTTQQIFRRYRPVFETYKGAFRDPPLRWLKWRPTPFFAVVIAVIFLLCLMRLVQHSEFLYYQF